MSNREQIHTLFRGVAELSKKVRGLGLGLELVAGVFAVSGIFAQQSNWSAWQPLIAFTLVALALLARLWSGRLAKFTEVCRRESARAYACGREIGYARLSTLKSDAPSVSNWLAQRLPASTIDDYYEAQCPEGDDRLREIYANSAFHSWRLMRAWSRIIGVFGVIWFFVTFALVYGLATDPRSAESTSLLLDALCSIVLTVLSLRAIEVGIQAGSAAVATRRIADVLVTRPLPSGDALERLVRDYDFERCGSPPIPTWLYKLRRSRLASDWEDRRRALF